MMPNVKLLVCLSLLLAMSGCAESRQPRKPQPAPAVTQTPSAPASPSDPARPKTASPRIAVEPALERFKARRARQLDAGLQPTAAVTPADSRLLAPADEALLERLRSGEVVRAAPLAKAKGGGFRVVLRDGTEALFKPNASVELARFYLDRALGLGRALPAVRRSIPKAVQEAGKPEKEGVLEGALIQWSPATKVVYKEADDMLLEFLSNPDAKLPRGAKFQPATIEALRALDPTRLEPILGSDAARELALRRSTVLEQAGAR